MSSLRDHGPTWVAVGPPALLDVLVPLRDEHGRRGAAILVPGDVGTSAEIASQFRTASVLIVEDPTQPSARSSFAGPFFSTAHRERLLRGWIRLERAELAAYVRRAVALLRRSIEREMPVLLLGPRERRYSQLLDEVEQVAGTGGAISVFRWSADRLARHRLASALRCGAGALIYTGHGSADGWLAYGGVQGAAVTGNSPWADDETIGITFSLSCRTGAASARSDPANRVMRNGFADQMIASGAAGIVFAPVTDSLHADTRMLARLLAHALAQGHRSCCDVLDMVRSEGALLGEYVVVGDPGLAAAAAPGSADRCRAVRCSSGAFIEGSAQPAASPRAAPVTS